jgi:hypothetical protein
MSIILGRTGSPVDVTPERKDLLMLPHLPRTRRVDPRVVFDDDCVGGIIVRQNPITCRLNIQVYVGADLAGRPQGVELTEKSPIEHFVQFYRRFVAVPELASWWTKQRPARPRPTRRLESNAPHNTAVEFLG